MAKKGFFHAFLSSTVVAVLAFFILYFFIPSMSMQFLGVSFAYREGSVNALVLDAVEGAVQKVQGDPTFTKESFEQLKTLLSSEQVQQQLKDAAKQGQQVLEGVVQQVTESVQ